MSKVKLRCKCGNDKLIFSWKWKNKAEMYQMFLCHDGYGFQFEDSIIECTKCKQKKKYDKFKMEVKE